MGHALARQEFTDAVTRFDRAPQRRDIYTPALVGRGEALLALKREPEALASFEVVRRGPIRRWSTSDAASRCCASGWCGDLADAQRAGEAGRYEEAAQATNVPFRHRRTARSYTDLAP